MAMCTQCDLAFRQEVVDAFRHCLDNTTEELYEGIVHMVERQLFSDSTDCQWWLNFCQWWLNGMNNPCALVVDHLYDVENAAVGFDFDNLRVWMNQDARFKKSIVGSVFMKDIYPCGPPTQLFQMQLEKMMERNNARATMELADKQLEGWLKVLGVESDEEVDELLMLDHPSLDWSYLDGLVPMGKAETNLRSERQG